MNKKCKFCQMEIDSKATKCLHCQADLRNWFKRHPIWTTVFIFLIIVFALASSSSNSDKNQPIKTEQQTSNQDQPKTEDKKPQEWYKVITLSGKGNQDTSSFSISGDKVRITATTCCGSANIGTYSGINLKSENNDFLGTAGLSISTKSDEKGQGETTYRNIKPGKYYISVITGVNWDVKVEEYR